MLDPMQRITIGSHELKRTHIIDIGPQSRSHAIKVQGGVNVLHAEVATVTIMLTV